MSSDNHTATPDAANVVALTDQIMTDGPSAATELERKRHIIVRAFQVTMKQLEADALKLAESGLISEHPLQKRFQIMRQAEALYMAVGWLQGLCEESTDGNDVKNGSNAS